MSFEFILNKWSEHYRIFIQELLFGENFYNIYVYTKEDEIIQKFVATRIYITNNEIMFDSFNFPYDDLISIRFNSKNDWYNYYSKNCTICKINKNV